MSNHRSMFSGGFDGNRSNHVQACTKNSNYFQPNHHHSQHHYTQQNEHKARRSVNSDSVKENSKIYGANGRQPPQFGAGWSKANELRSDSTASGEGKRRPSNGSQSKNYRDRSRPHEFGRGWSGENRKESDGRIGNRTFHSISMTDARGYGAGDPGNGDVPLGMKSNRARVTSGSSCVNATGRDNENKYYEYQQEKFNAVTDSYYCNEKDIYSSANKSLKSKSAYSNATERGASKDYNHGYQHEMEHFGATNYHASKKDSNSAANNSFNVLPVAKTRGSSECDSRRSYSKNADVLCGYNEEAGFKARLDSLEYHHKKWRSVSRHNNADENYRKESHPISHHIDYHHSHQGMPANVRGNPHNNSYTSNGSRYHSHGYNNTQYNAPNANKSFHSIQTYDSHKYSSAAYCIDSNFTRSGMCRRGSWNHQSRGSQDQDQHHASSYRSGSYKGPNTSESFNRQNADNYCARQSIDVFHQSALDKNSDSNRVYESELDDDVFEQVAATDAESIAQENQSDGQNQTVDNFACAAPEFADTKSHIKFNRTFGGYDAQFETSFSTMQLGNLATMTDHSPAVELTETPMEKVEPERSIPCQVQMSKNVFKFGGDIYEITSEIGFLFESFDIKKDWRKPMQYQYDFRADGSSDETVRWLTRLRDLSKSHDNLYAESAIELKDTRFNAKKIRRDSEPYNLRHMVHETSTDVWNAGNPPRRNAETIAADPTWNHATRLPKATFPDSPEPLKFAGKYFVHEGVVAKMPFLHIQSGTVSFKSANGKAVPMPPHFQLDLIPTRTHPVGMIPSGIYQYVAKSDPVYNAFKSSNCIKNMQRVNNNIPGKMCYATEDVFDNFMEDIRADWGSGKRVTRVAHATHQTNI